MAGPFDKLRENWAKMPSGTKLQTGLGAGQLLFGALMNNGKRPKMPIPGAVEEATTIARQQAAQTVRPGNDYAVSQINRSAGQGINALNRSLGSGSQILAGVNQINQNTNRALAENANQNTLFRFNATQNLQNSLARLGQYQNQQFQTNELQPYLTRQQTKNMLVGSGIQNIAQAAQTRDELGFYEKVYGNQSEGQVTNQFFPENPGTGSLDKPFFRLPQRRAGGFRRKPNLGYGGSQFEDDFTFKPQIRF